jgi:hypothetical protein
MLAVDELVIVVPAAVALAVLALVSWYVRRR